MGLRELKRERTRRLISDKAFELFTDHGFGRTTVEQIAAAAEVGPSTLYRYFPTKETLVLEFVEESLFGALNWLREQPTELDLRRYAERHPVELIGGVRFPAIGQLPYLLTLAGHGFYWFRLRRNPS